MDVCCHGRTMGRRRSDGSSPRAHVRPARLPARPPVEMLRHPSQQVSMGRLVLFRPGHRRRSRALIVYRGAPRWSCQ